MRATAREKRGKTHSAVEVAAVASAAAAEEVEEALRSTPRERRVDSVHGAKVRCARLPTERKNAPGGGGGAGGGGGGGPAKVRTGWSEGNEARANDSRLADFLPQMSPKKM